MRFLIGLDVVSVITDAADLLAKAGFIDLFGLINDGNRKRTQAEIRRFYTFGCFKRGLNSCFAFTAVGTRCDAHSCGFWRLLGE